MKQTMLHTPPGVPESFVDRCGSKVTGFLCGFDRQHLLGGSDVEALVAAIVLGLPHAEPHRQLLENLVGLLLGVREPAAHGSKLYERRRRHLDQSGPGRANYVTSRRIVRTTPAASGTATQKRTETEICGT